MTGKIPRTWAEYEIEVRKLEDEGLSTSDAQGVVDARMMMAGVNVNTLMMNEYNRRHAPSKKPKKKNQ